MLGDMVAALLLLGLATSPTGEKLDRGAVAVMSPQGVFVSWRLLPEDAKGTKFLIERANSGGTATVLTPKPLTGATCFLDTHPAPGDYTIRAVPGGRAKAIRSEKPYLSIPLKPLSGYTANDGSIGDLDGDGQLEIVVHRTGRTHDNSQKGETDPPILEAYKLDGTFLWRINLGKNIRDGAHYTQFLVYDFDGDGKAEVACKTSDGTVDGTGKVLGDPNADYRNATGYVLRGPERLTVFEGSTGKALDTVNYLPPRHPDTSDPTPEQLKAEWGDGYGNRVDRFLAAVAYLDGKHPSLMFSRGYYTRTVLAAWDFRNHKLQKRWVFDSKEGRPDFAGQGNHNLAVADVDGDGNDEILFGSMTIDDNGQGLYSTGLGHGDAIHVGDLDPTRPGLEVFAIHEHPRSKIGTTFRNAKTGQILWSKTADDVGRGMCADLDPRYPGCECWASNGGLWSAKGELISSKHPRGCNFAVWWDGDPLRELLDNTTITKWNWKTDSEEVLLQATGCASSNGTKATPVLSGDILGDWREEVIWRSADDSELRIYTTTIATPYRFTSLLADRQYRLALTWQNVGYNQPPFPSFDLASVLANP